MGTFERSAQQRSCPSWSPSSGEPGVGKSRLAAEALRAHRRAPGPGHIAAGPLPSVRRGDRVLGARGDRQGGVRHPRVGHADRGRGERLERALPVDEQDSVWLQGTPGPARRRAGGVRVAGGVVHGVAALPGSAEPPGPDRAGLRGPALGGRCPALLPGASGGLVGGRAAPHPLHGPPRGCTEQHPTWAAGLRERDHGQPGSVDRRGDRAPALLAPPARGPTSGHPASPPRAGRRQPFVRRGVRPPAHRPGPARRRTRRRPATRFGPGPDRRPAGHALAGAEEPAPGRLRDGEALLGGCPR